MREKLTVQVEDVEVALSKDEIAFGEYYLCTFNEKKAYKLAGYDGFASSNARRLLDKPAMVKYLVARVKEQVKEKYGEFSIPEWVEDLKMVKNMSMGKPIPLRELDVTTGKFKAVVEEVPVNCPQCNHSFPITKAVYKFDSNGANKSLETMGKFLKILTDRVEISTDITEEMLARLTDDQKMQFFTLFKTLKGDI